MHAETDPKHTTAIALRIDAENTGNLGIGSSARLSATQASSSQSDYTADGYFIAISDKSLAPTTPRFAVSMPFHPAGIRSTNTAAGLERMRAGAVSEWRCSSARWGKG
jgi:hypothetical protein